MSEANLKRASILNSSFLGANLRNANLKWSDLHQNNVQEADFRGASGLNTNMIINFYPIQIPARAIIQ